MKAAQISINDRPFIPLNEAAVYMGISKSLLYKLVARREIPHNKPGGRKIFFAKSDLDRWLEKGHVNSRAEIETAAENVAKRQRIY